MAQNITYLDYLNLIGPDAIEIDGVKADENGLRRSDWYDVETLRSLTPEERKGLKGGPAEWPSQDYVLRFPCTIEDLRDTLGTFADAINEEIAAEYAEANDASRGDAERPDSPSINVIRRTPNPAKSVPLGAEISIAKDRAMNALDVQSVWDELVKMAEKREGSLVGHSSDGVQYRGAQHQSTGEPDVFTRKNLRDRMRRSNAR